MTFVKEQEIQYDVPQPLASLLPTRHLASQAMKTVLYRQLPHPTFLTHPIDLHTEDTANGS